MGDQDPWIGPRPRRSPERARMVWPSTCFLSLPAAMSILALWRGPRMRVKTRHIHPVPPSRHGVHLAAAFSCFVEIGNCRAIAARDQTVEFVITMTARGAAAGSASFAEAVRNPSRIDDLPAATNPRPMSAGSRRLRLSQPGRLTAAAMALDQLPDGIPQWLSFLRRCRNAQTWPRRYKTAWADHFGPAELAANQAAPRRRISVRHPAIDFNVVDSGSGRRRGRHLPGMPALQPAACPSAFRGLLQERGLYLPQL